jgi:renalase
MPAGSPPAARVVVVGAGLSGLSAARRLGDRGIPVLLLDRSIGPGGRLATRRIGPATLDHGAQFFTVRSGEFGAKVSEWLERGVVHEWNRGFATPDGHPRYVASAGMNALAKDLAHGTDIVFGALAFAVTLDATDPHPIGVVTDDGVLRRADAAIITCPLPQAYSLVLTAGVDVTNGPFHAEYDRTLALLTRIDRPVDLGPAGGVQQADDVFSFIGDNVHKGISTVPALTFHARPDWSEAHWDLDRAATHEALLESARSWLAGASVLESQVKRWRFATPQRVWPERCWSAASGRLVVAGDAFAGPRIEAAYLSGAAAADTVAAAIA